MTYTLKKEERLRTRLPVRQTPVYSLHCCCCYIPEKDDDYYYECVTASKKKRATYGNNLNDSSFAGQDHLLFYIFYLRKILLKKWKVESFHFRPR